MSSNTSGRSAGLPEQGSKAIRVHIYIEGIVQGVGFRPFLHRLAEQYQIRGWVRNTSSGLEGVLEGDPCALEQFTAAVKNSPPPMAVVERVETVPDGPEAGIKSGVFPSPESVPLAADPSDEFSGFSIRKSFSDPGFTLISPDIAICPECAKELYTPSDRRYRYPFINCTNCGPRYTIIESLPYDRERTVMREFRMCDECEKEYHDIRDRRYHAQPDCCPKCGPQVFFVPGSDAGNLYGTVPGSSAISGRSSVYGENAFRLSQELLRVGGILAVKGIGGVHLACNAEDPDAVIRLRERKHRAEKPLAVMCRSLEAVRRLCLLTPEEENLLTDPAHPIVLLAKKDRGCFKELSFSPRLGVMLPYTPLHMLLLDGTYGGPDAVVMTSGNVPGCPVITENGEAFRALKDVADGFLLHDRRIRNRCDDSLIAEWKGQPYFYRKSRGYAPRPVDLKKDADGIFAMGAEQKASFALGKGSHVFLSPHIGDLKNAETLTHYRESLETYCRLFRLKPSLYVCDLHPDYLSSREAADASQRDSLPLLKIQHHWAHMASCMADNRLESPCFGIVWDGTGLGTDGTIWGGEFLEGDLTAFTRKGSIRPIPLPGGDRAIREIGRIGLSLARDAGISDSSLIPLPEEKQKAMDFLLSSGSSPAASSIGRLFDGVCALILGRSDADYEGEGAALVESLSPVETIAAIKPMAPVEAMDSAETTDILETADAMGIPGRRLSGTMEVLSYPREYYDLDGIRTFDLRPLTRGIVNDLKKGVDAGRISLRFMSTLCCMALDQCLSLNPDRKPVILSGGVFQNRFLLTGVSGLLEENGFSVYTHRQVSANDEGISLGQLSIAQKKRSMNHVFSNANED